MGICSDTFDIVGTIWRQGKFNVCFSTILSMNHTGWMQKTHPVDPNYTEIHKHTQTSASYLSAPAWVMSHTHSHLLLELAIWFQIILILPLHSNSPATTLLTPTSKHQVLFQGEAFMYFLTTYYTVIFMRFLSFRNMSLLINLGFPGGSVLKNLHAKQKNWVWSLGWIDPSQRKWHPTPVLLPRKFHGQRNLAGYSP